MSILRDPAHRTRDARLRPKGGATTQSGPPPERRRTGQPAAPRSRDRRILLTGPKISRSLRKPSKARVAAPSVTVLPGTVLRRRVAAR